MSSIYQVVLLLPAEPPRKKAKSGVRVGDFEGRVREKQASTQGLRLQPEEVRLGYLQSRFASY